MINIKFILLFLSSMLNIRYYVSSNLVYRNAEEQSNYRLTNLPNLPQRFMLKVPDFG